MLVFRSEFGPCRIKFCLLRTTSEFSRVLHLRQNVNNFTRAKQHGASGLIATHARFFDAGSYGGGPEIPHEDDCEKFGPSTAYSPPKRATRANSRWLVYYRRSVDFLKMAIRTHPGQTRVIAKSRKTGAEWK